MERQGGGDRSTGPAASSRIGTRTVPGLDEGISPVWPDIDADRCVLAIAVEASCRACQSACPRAAWVIADDSLGLDTQACDGCAVCMAACPQGAIEIVRPPVAIGTADPATAFAACEMALSGGKGVMPCLDAIGLDELARMHRRGIRRLVVARGECGRCPRGPAHRAAAESEAAVTDLAAPASFDAAGTDLDRLLADRGLGRFVIQATSADGWIKARDEAMAPSRRGLLLGWRQTTHEMGEGAGARLPAAELLGTNRPAPALAPFLPVIDAAVCEACDACLRVCPHRAIEFTTLEAGGIAYTVRSGRCTGCNLCADVCTAGAVAVQRWRLDTGLAVRLDSKQCRACGNTYRMVVDRSGEQELCRICARTGHNRKLFQVMP